MAIGEDALVSPTELLREAALPTIGPVTALSGGDLSEVWKIGPYVVKTAAAADPLQFPTEAIGLRALANRGCRIPHIHYASSKGIVLDYLPEGPSDDIGLGRKLAQLHQTTYADYTWTQPVFIGAYQLPTCKVSLPWSTFWQTLRIEPLLRSCGSQLGTMRQRIVQLLAGYDVPVEGPRLLHGDLWSGNVLMTAQGAALIDPSVWIGERGVDLAMMRLFGGFSQTCWDAYEEILPIPAAVEDAIPFYQLYYVLVHVHFFGASYVGSVQKILRKYGY